MVLGVYRSQIYQRFVLLLTVKGYPWQITGTFMYPFCRGLLGQEIIREQGCGFHNSVRKADTLHEFSSRLPFL